MMVISNVVFDNGKAIRVITTHTKNKSKIKILSSNYNPQNSSIVPVQITSSISDEKDHI